MTNDDARMTNQPQSTNDERLIFSDFGFCHSFIMRTSSFVTLRETFCLTELAARSFN